VQIFDKTHSVLAVSFVKKATNKWPLISFKRTKGSILARKTTGKPPENGFFLLRFTQFYVILSAKQAIIRAKQAKREQNGRS